MKLTIETADNGFILSYYDSEAKETRKITIEDEETDARTTQKLLWNILEHFGLDGSKHDAERVYIVLKDQEGKEIEL